MKIIEKKEDKIVFVVSGIDETIANSIRRASYEVPILAIDEVEFVKNDSALYDEMLAHRIGLVPLKTDKTFVKKEECSCKGKGCAKCTVTFKLEAKGPITVYSSNLKGKADVVFKEMPLVILEKNQELKLAAYAKLGNAREHAKFSPGLVFFRPLVNIKTSQDVCKECVEACPQNILVQEGKKAIIKNIEMCDACEACVEACKHEEKKCIQIELSNDTFIFTIESFGQIALKDIFIESVKTITEDLKELQKKLKL